MRPVCYVVVHMYNPNTQKAEAENLDFNLILGYTWFLCLKAHPEIGLFYTGILNNQCSCKPANTDFLLA